MPQIINTNMASLNAQRNLDKSQTANQTALQRLSSGLRINSAKDDAAGMAISTRFTSQIKGLNVAVRNAGDGIALAQTAEGALGSMNDNLQRIRELAVQSANATNSEVDREALQAEVSQLISEITRTAEETNFNGRKLLNGDFNAIFQVGANAGETIDVNIANLTAGKLGSSAQAGVSAIGNSSAIGNGDLVINGVSIGASRAEDDNSSTNNAGASAIAKVEAVNRHSAETGVTAYVNENTVSGSEMTASQANGTITLNGVNINLSVTNDAAQTRAGVVQAINSVSDQTGITAIDSGKDNGGVSLVAADGRNVQLAYGTGLTAANTGLAAADTYEGGYTLVASGETKSIDIKGGDGTGNGDLRNAGLVEGSYSRATAVTVSEAQSSTQQATVIGDGTAATTYSAAAAGLAANNAITVKVGDQITDILATTGATMASVINGSGGLASVDGIKVWEQIDAKATVSTLAAGNTLTIGTVSVAITGTAGDFAQLAKDINATNFGGLKYEVSAEYSATGVEINIRNYASTSVALATTTAGTLSINLGGTQGDTGSLATGFLSGKIAFASADSRDVTMDISSPHATLGTAAGILSQSRNDSAEFTGVNGLGDGDLVI